MSSIKKGFTLIELLIVIAIIGILSVVVFATLSNSKKKTVDGVIKGELKSAQVQAAVYGDEHDGNYANLCTDPDFQKFTDAAAVAYNNDTNSDNCVISGAINGGGNLAWAAYVPLKSQTGWWCVDSRGISKLSHSFAAASCPY